MDSLGRKMKNGVLVSKYTEDSTVCFWNGVTEYKVTPPAENHGEKWDSVADLLLWTLGNDFLNEEEKDMKEDFNISVVVNKNDDTLFTKEESDKLADEFIEFIESKQCSCGGSIGIVED